MLEMIEMIETPLSVPIYLIQLLVKDASHLSTKTITNCWRRPPYSVYTIPTIRARGGEREIHGIHQGRDQNSRTAPISSPKGSNDPARLI